ncbi:hypothetical protein WA026_011262, partial [Henosepilachna vigintioctopunctata]
MGSSNQDVNKGAQRSDDQVWVLVHTMTITDVDYQVQAQFIHTLSGNIYNLERIRLLARRVRMSIYPGAVRSNLKKRISLQLNAPKWKKVIKKNTATIKHHLRTYQ